MKHNFNKLATALLTSILATTLTCCHEKEEEIDNNKVWGFQSKNLVTGYIFPETIRIKTASSEDSAMTAFRIETSGFIASRDFVDYESKENPFRVNHLLDEKDFEKSISIFDSMAVVYNDTALNKLIPMGGHWAFSHRIDSISITSSEDYDTEHPAGSNLSDITTINTDTYGNYVPQEGINRAAEGFELEKRVSELTESDRTRLAISPQMSEDNDCEGYLRMGTITGRGKFWIPKSSAPKECQLTVTFFFANGQKLSASAQVIL